MLKRATRWLKTSIVRTGISKGWGTGGIDAQLGLARVSLDEEQQLDKAAALLADALTSSLSLEFKLGQADANLSLARMSLLQGSVE
jgi:hypothetical protein